MGNDLKLLHAYCSANCNCCSSKKEDEIENIFEKPCDCKNCIEIHSEQKTKSESIMKNKKSASNGSYQTFLTQDLIDRYQTTAHSNNIQAKDIASDFDSDVNSNEKLKSKHQLSSPDQESKESSHPRLKNATLIVQDLINDLNWEQTVPESAKTEKTDKGSEKGIELSAGNGNAAPSISDNKIGKIKRKYIVGLDNKIEEKSEEYTNDSKISKIGEKNEKLKEKLKEKKTKESKEDLEIWMRISIKSIIPEVKLKSMDEDEILFQGEVLKLSPLTSCTNASHANKYYSTKFLIFTKREFRCYKSKESFLTLQNPIQKVPIFQISEVLRVTINSPIKEKKLYHFAVKLLSEEVSNSLLNNLDSSSLLGSSSKYGTQKSLIQLYKDKKLEDIYNELLEKSLNESNPEVKELKRRKSSKKKRKSMKINKLENKIVTEFKESNQDIVNKKQLSEQVNIFAKNVLIFASEKENLVNKWVRILDYFTSKI